MEIRVAGDPSPVYDLNLEDLGRFNETPVLPFNAYGTLAWARSEFDNNSASSQVGWGEGAPGETRWCLCLRCLLLAWGCCVNSTRMRLFGLVQRLTGPPPPDCCRFSSC